MADCRKKMHSSFVFALLLSFLSCFICSRFVLSESSVNSMENKLKCDRTGNLPTFAADPSKIYDIAGLQCSDHSNVYHRFNWTMIALSDKIQTYNYSIRVGQDSNIKRNQNPFVNTDGCSLSNFEESASNKRCSRLEFDLQFADSQLLYGADFAKWFNKTINQLVDEGIVSPFNPNFKDFTFDDVVQSLDIEFEVSKTRYAYDLKPQPDHIIPFGYLAIINETMDAYNEAMNGTLTSGISGKKCVPSIFDKTSRISAVLGSCYRAACNCTTEFANGDDVPEFYTYELHSIGGSCEMRSFLFGGEPRLTATITMKMYATSRLAGVIIDKREIFAKKFWDITSSFSGSSRNSRHSLNALSGTFARYTSRTGANGLRLSTKSGLIISPRRHGGAINTFYSPIFVGIETKKASYSTKEKMAFNSSVELGNVVDDYQFINAPILDRGYVVDCLKYDDLLTNSYRNNGDNPYEEYEQNAFGIPKDRWYYMSDALSRENLVFSDQVDNVCGLIGMTSKHLVLEHTTIDQECCSEDFLNGKCTPGSGFNLDGFSSALTPSEIFAEGALLYNQLFSPPNNFYHDYFLNGKHSLNYQQLSKEKGGRDPLVHNSMPDLEIDFLVELSDMILKYKDINERHIAPLDFANATMVDSDIQVDCQISTSKTGLSAIIISSICNVDDFGTVANISATLQNFGGNGFVRDLYTNRTIDGVYQLGSKKAKKCFYNVHIPGIYIPALAYDDFAEARANIGSEIPMNGKVIFSSTKGSTNELEVDNVKCRLVPGHMGQTTNINEEGLDSTYEDIYPNCEDCKDTDLACLAKCKGELLKSSHFAFFFIIVPTGAIIGVLIWLGVECIEYQKSKRIMKKKKNK